MSNGRGRTKVPLRFGPGLDRATGSMAVQPGAMEDLRNFYLLDEKLQSRKGFASPGALSVPGVPAITHVLAGHPLRSEGVGIVVGWSEPAGEVHVFRVTPDGTSADHLGLWFEYESTEFAPIIHICEVFGRIFMAHDEPRALSRAPTFVYDPVTPQDGLLSQLEDEFTDGGPHPMKFRGVVAHLDYLVGWGYGTAELDRPELVRISLPGEPREFEARHYFIAGDRRDPVLQCVPGASSLIVFKGGEWHEMFGSHRGNFGMVRRDPLYGLLAPRLAVNVSGLVFFWDATGPRVTDGSSTSQSMEIPLDLQGFESADLPDEADPCESFATYVWEDRVVLFVFGQRAYAATVRQQGDWKWSYWTFPWHPLCAFTLWDSQFALTDAPVGYPEWDDEEAAGTYVDIDIVNVNQEGDERLEVWLSDTSEPGYFLALSGDVLLSAEQEIRVTGLTPGRTYDGAVRYRRGNRVAEGYTGDPATWPGVSQSQFTTALDPPELGTLDAEFGQRFADTGEEDWVWERTAVDAQYLQFKVTPNDEAGAGHTMKIYRSDDGGAFTEIDELTEGVDFDEGVPFLYKDEDPTQDVFVHYRATSIVGGTESPMSLPLGLWAGPCPEAWKVAVPGGRSTTFASDRLTYTHRSFVIRLQEVIGEDHSTITYYDNWDDSVPEFTASPDQDRGDFDYGFAAEPIDQQPPDFGQVTGALNKKDVVLSAAVPSGETIEIGVQFEATRHGTTDSSPMFTVFVAVP